KQFVIPFNSGVIVITHWKQNNYLRNDRYTPTIYKDEMKRLSAIQGVYHLDTIGIPQVSRLDTQEGSKEGRKRESDFNKNEDQLSQMRIDAHFARGREILKSGSKTRKSQDPT